MKRPPGFLSAAGIAAAAALLLGVLAWTVLAGPVLFSPGELNAETGDAGAAGSAGAEAPGVASHADLGGDCGACHPAPWSSETMAVRCLACHEETRAQVEAGKGLHGRLAGPPSSPTCRDCHPEHGGPRGALTSLDAASFPHDRTGYSLRTHQRTEAGGRFACADCHEDGYSAFDEAVCTRCHAGIDDAFMTRHEATYGKECLACHDGSGRDGAGFDHATTSFALKGAHTEVACRECHAGARSRRDLERTPHACYACHAEDDEHRGSYGRRCGQCHSAAGWSEVDFDHSVFPLDHGSEERRAGCETCHPRSTRTYTCYGCHEHTRPNVLDEHEGRSLGQLTDCVRCHPGGEEAQEEED